MHFSFGTITIEDVQLTKEVKGLLKYKKSLMKFNEYKTQEKN